MANYLAYDANGKILSLQGDTPGIVTTPVNITGGTTVVCTAADAVLASSAIGTPSAYWNGSQVVALPASPGAAYNWDWPTKTWIFDLTSGQATKNAQINAAAQTALTAVIAAYPDLEVSTWPQQYAEAQAYTANNTAATPMLSSISTASGLSVSALAANVMAKAAAYQNASGAIIGRRIALQTNVAAAKTQADLDAIVW